MNIVRNNYYILLKTIPTLIFARFHDFILQNNMIGKHWNYFLSSRLCLHCSLHLKFLTHGWFHTSQNLYRYKYLKFTFHIIPIFLYFFLCHFIVSRKTSIRFEWIDSAIGKLLKLPTRNKDIARRELWFDSRKVRELLISPRKTD